MGSYGQRFPYRCGNGHSGKLDVWLVVDAAERPDLLRQAAAGELTPPRCPSCGADAGIAAPLSLLIYRPDKHPEMLFGSTSTAGDPAQRQAAFSMMALNRGRGEPRSGAAIQVPYGLLGTMAARDVDADADALDAGRFSAPSAELQRYAQWLSGYSVERFKQAGWSALTGLLQADSPASVRELFEAHPVLLDQRFDRLLAVAAETADEEGQPQMASVARERRDLLRRINEFGLDRALEPEQAPPTVHAKIATPDAAEPDEAAADAGTLSPAVGAALLALAGMPAVGSQAPEVPSRLRELLQRALAQMSEAEAALAMKYEHDELLGLRDLMSDALALELSASPRDPHDLLLAQRLLDGLGYSRETTPCAWAKARHNRASIAERLAAPGDVAAADAARADYELALTVRTADAYPDEWAQTTVALANLLCDSYPGHDPAYLARSVDLLEAALSAPAPRLSQRSRLSLLVTLASSLLRQGERRGDVDLLRRAADTFASVNGEAKQLGAAEIQRVGQANYAMALGLLADRTGRLADWQQAVTMGREALADAAGGTTRQWLSAAINLSIALRHVGDVEAAIPLMRQTLERARSEQLWYALASTHNNLGNALLDRTEGDRDENVDQAIAAFESGRRIWTREKFPNEWALNTARLARAYEATADGRGRAEELLREAIAPVSRAERPVEWARLANRIAWFEPPAEAIPRYEAAAEVLSRDAFPYEWAGIQHNLGGRYRAMAADSRTAKEAVGYLKAASERYRQALAIRPPGEAPLQWGETATAAANVLRERAAREENGTSGERRRRAHRAEAVRMYREALQVLAGGAPAERIIAAAGALGSMYAEDGQWTEAAEALSTASDAADRQYATSLLRRSREETISQHNWLSAALAYCLLQLDRPADAVRALERGRARLLGEALARDPDQVAAAKTTDPHQYEAYTEAARRLGLAEAASVRLLAAAPADDGGADTYHRQAEQAARDGLRAARTAFQEASSRLPELPPIEEQRPGNVTCYLFTTGSGGWALLAWPGRMQSLRLPGINAVALAQLAESLLQAQGSTRRELLAALTAALGVLGQHVLAPVADALRAGQAAGVALVPVGLFGAFPLHAAPIDPAGSCLLDQLAVSYAPSAAVLAQARGAGRQRAADGRQPMGVAVTDPDAGLAFAGPEAEAMLRWTGGRRVDAAADVLDELADRAVTHVHFACHGQSLADRPLDSYLALGQGRRLTTLDLLAGDRPDLLRGARLVVASACQTGITDLARVPDEFIGLGAGFLAAGVPCFVGTLWSADDVPAGLLMTRFYELLAGGGVAVDEALRQAQRWLRDLDGRALHAYLSANPGLAQAQPGLAALAQSRPDQRFYSDPVSWSPYVVIGDGR